MRARCTPEKVAKSREAVLSLEAVSYVDVYIEEGSLLLEIRGGNESEGAPRVGDSGT